MSDNVISDVMMVCKDLNEWRHRKVDVRIIAQYIIKTTYYEHGQDFDKMVGLWLDEIFDHIKRADYFVHCDEMSEEFQFIAGAYVLHSYAMDSDEMTPPHIS